MVTESMAQLSSPKEELDVWNVPEDRSGHNSLPCGSLQHPTRPSAQGVLPGSAGSQLLHPPPCLAPRCGEVSLLGGRVVTSVIQPSQLRGSCASPSRLPQPCGQLPRDHLRVRAPPWRPAVRGFPVSRGRVTSGTIPFSQALLGHTPDTRDGRAPRCGEAAHTPLFCRLETAYV